MKKISFLIMFIFLSINIFGQLPPIVGFDQMIYVYDNKIEVPLGEFDIVAPDPEPDPEPATEYRRVYFVHGLGGDAGAWVDVSEAFWNTDLNIQGFPARKVEVEPLSYDKTTQGTLGAAANAIRNDIRRISTSDIALGMTPSNAFIIAHSQGGLVCRTLLHRDFVQNPDNIPYYGAGYGGLVTVASPLQGAMILNNRDMILDLAQMACESLLAGPEASLHGVEKILVNKVIRNLGLEDTAITYACRIISKDLLPIFFQHFYDQITSDYIVGANMIDTLNNDTNNSDYRNMQKIAFYAIEDQSNIFWRTVNWFTTDPNSVDHFQANDDFGFYVEYIGPEYRKYKRRTEDFQANVDKNNAKKNNLWNWAIPLLGAYYCNQYNINIKKRNAWNEGVRFFETVNATWEVIIGARRYHINPSYPHKIEGYSYYPNDGVVLQESAANLPCATWTPVPLYNSSHMQVRNNFSIKIAMRNLLNGEYGDFFKTEVQPLEQ